MGSDFLGNTNETSPGQGTIKGFCASLSWFLCCCSLPFSAEGLLLGLVTYPLNWALGKIPAHGTQARLLPRVVAFLLTGDPGVSSAGTVSGFSSRAGQLGHLGVTSPWCPD